MKSHQGTEEAELWLTVQSDGVGKPGLCCYRDIGLDTGLIMAYLREPGELKLRVLFFFFLEIN